jgi:CRP-like cAMP-binding protein
MSYGGAAMQPDARSRRLNAVAPHPLSELMQCPLPVENLLNCASECFDLESGDLVFRQFDNCRGLYLVLTGEFQRRTEWFGARLKLGLSGPGAVVELSAALGQRPHTYTLSALSSGSVVMLPIGALHSAFQTYPPLRMRMLEELAREVSRAYK